jgi:uncharacterized membrane protein YciS (DUF1049 family)
VLRAAECGCWLQLASRPVWNTSIRPSTRLQLRRYNAFVRGFSSKARDEQCGSASDPRPRFDAPHPSAGTVLRYALGTVGYALSTVGYAVSTVRYAVSTVGYAVSTVGYALGTVGYAVSTVRYALSTVGYAVSTVRYALGTVGYALGTVGYALSTVGYALGTVGYARRWIVCALVFGAVH